MNDAVFPALDAKSAVVLAGSDYLSYLGAACEQARERIWASVFLVDPRPHRDKHGYVAALLETLVAARLRGVDVRVILGRPRDASTVYLANVTTQFYLDSARSLPTRIYAGSARAYHHSKYVVIDSSDALIGSHNWTDDAFAVNAELSVHLDSPDVNRRLAGDHVLDWTASAPESGRGP